MNKPEVTVVLPVYNAASTLDATLASILSQTFTDFELIAVDDGSNDDSLQILLSYARQDSRIRIVAQENHGVSSARNLGAALGTARYIAFIDADDIWHSTKLARHIALHQDEPMIAASYARIAFLPSNSTSLTQARTLSSLCRHRLELTDVLGENPVCTTSNLFIRRDWFSDGDGFDEQLSYAEDQEFVAGIIERGAKVEGIDAVLTGYRFSSDGLSMDLERMHAGWRIVAKRYLEGECLTAFESLYCRYLARRILRAGGRPMKALRYALAGLQLDATAFLNDRRRGFATLAAVFAAPLIPAMLRRHLFA